MLLTGGSSCCGDCFCLQPGKYWGYCEAAYRLGGTVRPAPCFTARGETRYR